MHFPAANSPENRDFSPLNMQILMLFLMFLTVKAESSTGQAGMPSGDVVTNFQPSLAVVVGVLAIMFSLTFILLVFTKCCHRRSPENHLQNRILSRSRSRYSGIDKTVIESLPFFRFSALKGSKQGLECAVCLSKFEDIEILRLLPKCKHAFHINCVDQWLEKHSSCPLCRHKVSIDDIALITNSTSLRFLQSQSDMRQDSNLELFVQREEDFHQGSSRYSQGSSFRGIKEEEELPIQESCDNNENCEEILHKFNHRIIISDVVLKNRWSSVSSSDLMFLNSEMINAMSSNRFSSKESENEQFATTKGIEDGDQIMKIKEEMGRKRLFENKLSKINQTGSIPFSGLTNNANPGNTSKILDPTEKRSMSEIIVHPRFTEFSTRNRTEDSSCPENNVKEERLRRLWLPIARRTVHWFANREKRSTMSQNTRQSLDV